MVNLRDKAGNAKKKKKKNVNLRDKAGNAKKKKKKNGEHQRQSLK